MNSLLPALPIIENIPYATKLIHGRYKYPVTITKKADRLWFSFGFNKGIMEEIKSMEGHKWHGFETPPIKQWSVVDSAHNRFRILFMEGKNPYAFYDKPLIEASTRRPTYEHQIELFRHMITRLYCIVSSEMGTGKTLAVIEAIEWLYANNDIRSWFYVAPKSALTAVQLEFEKWRSLIQPQFYTYDALRELVKNWPAGMAPPNGIVYDESSRVKTPTSQRSEAAKHMAHAIRQEHGVHGAVILMSGTPAPKSPLDWFNQCQIACPGFLREGTYEKFRRRLAVMAEGQNDAGQVFSKLVTWKDDSTKCDTCGKPKEDFIHDPINMIETDYHEFKPATNEVQNLYKRMKGLVIVKFKKDCLSLPDKQYRIVTCTPTPSIINAARIITARNESVIKTMTLLRELSDGFQYESQEVGVQVCPLCAGKRTRLDWKFVGPDDLYEEMVDLREAGQEIPSEYFEQVEMACSNCNGLGEVAKYVREAVQVPCPKEDALREIIDEHDDVGRLVTYAGFTGSIERVVAIYLKARWDVIRVDGRGWWSNVPGKAKDLIKRFQYEQETYPRLAFVGQPAAAGMGLTLTASPSIVYYSNDFNGESRSQSEDRIHRPGMDLNRGATIIDLIHLPTDQVVLDNLKRKRKLELITMGEFQAALN